MPSKVQIAVAKVKAKRKLKAIDAALEAQDSSLIERILGRIVLPTPEKAKDGENAPQMSEILEAITPLLPETKVEQTTVVEKIDPQDMEEFIKGLLPKEDLTLRPAVEQITVDVSDDKLEEFVSKEEMKEHLRKIQDAITSSQGGGGSASRGDLVHVIQVTTTQSISSSQLLADKYNVILVMTAGVTITLPVDTGTKVIEIKQGFVGTGSYVVCKETS